LGYNNRALLIGVSLPHIPLWEAENSLEELTRLADAALLITVEHVIQSRDRIDSAFFIGKGKVEEIKKQSKKLNADLLIFDNDLSPAQMRNLEDKTEMRILDRSALILDIFSRHARTRTAQVQVELAQLNYLLPRLTRMWTHLSRQAGGGAIRGMGSAGVRGPGETQLETDRRIIHRQINNLEKKLERINTQMATGRKSRQGIFSVALVGYTNSGKSTLMRALSNSDILVEDQLFATLDSTTRSVKIGSKNKILLTDTVGFINRLPHHLFASFRATLEEAIVADLLLHVVDLSFSNYESQMRTVDAVLRDLNLEDRPILTVFNKIDRIHSESEQIIIDAYNKRDNSIAISAANKIGLEKLCSKIKEFMDGGFINLNLKIPQSEGRVLSTLKEKGDIIIEDYENNYVIMKLRLEKLVAEKLKLERFSN
jgi:GTP-binding protein HflX